MPAEVPGSVTGLGRSESGRPAPPRALARLTGPHEAAFDTRYWSREPLLIRGADAHAFADLLDLDGVDELLSCRGLRTPFLRLARNGSVVDSSSFIGPGGVGAEIGDQVRDDAVAAAFAGGATVVLQAVHRLWPPVIDFVTRLAAELGHPVQANAYVTPPSSRGFSAHFDVHDVFVLQLAGRKHWQVHAPVHPDPLRDQPWNSYATQVASRAQDEPAIDVVLEPGDVMYLPRGWVHAATALGGVSAHLTLGVHVVTRYALVEALAALVSADADLRASLPVGVDVADPAALAPHLEDVRAALRGALDRVSVEAVSRRVRRRVWTGSRPEPVRPVAGAAFAEGLSRGDAVRLRLGLGHRLVEGGDPDTDLVLELPDRRIQLPAATGTALRALLSGAVLQIGAVPGLDEADQVVLVRRLLREGVLVPATRP